MCRQDQHSARVRRLWIALGTASAAVLALGACSSSGSGNPARSDASGAPRSLGKVTVGLSSLTGFYAPVFWAADKGYFAKAGLDVKVTNLAAGTIPALVAGRADLTSASLGTFLGVQNQGKAVKVIYETDTAPQVVVAADSKITSPAQCKSMATSTLGSNVRAMTVLAEQVYNVKWNLVELTTADTFAPTVISGRSDCAMGTSTFFAQAEAQGKLHTIFDSGKASSLPAGWPTAGGPMGTIGGLASDLTAKADAIAVFLKAYDTAVQDFLTTASSDIAKTLIAGKGGWETNQADALAADIDASKEAMRPNAGYITTDSWTPTLTYFVNGGLTFVNPSDPKWSYGSIVDMSYYDNGIGKPAGQ